jgi:formylglycine-generating enzyme required for sulfatase activity
MEEYEAYPDGTVEDNLEGTTVSTKIRVLRGGSFFLNDLIARSSYRDYDAPSIQNNDIGFRLARTR